MKNYSEIYKKNNKKMEKYWILAKKYQWGSKSANDQWSIEFDYKIKTTWRETIRLMFKLNHGLCFKK